MAPPEMKNILNENKDNTSNEVKAKEIWLPECSKKTKEYWLENGPVCRAFAVETSLLLSSQNVPDDDSLWILLSVHYGAEGHNIPGKNNSKQHKIASDVFEIQTIKHDNTIWKTFQYCI